jgi:hypothetical protein
MTSAITIAVRTSKHKVNVEKVKLSPQQTMDAYGVVRCSRSHTAKEIGSQTAVSLSALRAGLRFTPQKHYVSASSIIFI